MTEEKDTFILKALGVIGVGTVVLIGLAGGGDNTDPNPEWDRARVAEFCENAIKVSLNDPASYQHIDTVAYGVTTMDGKGKANVTFSARNAFGGRVRSKGFCTFEDRRLTEFDIYRD